MKKALLESMILKQANSVKNVNIFTIKNVLNKNVSIVILNLNNDENLKEVYKVYIIKEKKLFLC